MDGWIHIHTYLSDTDHLRGIRARRHRISHMLRHAHLRVWAYDIYVDIDVDLDIGIHGSIHIGLTCTEACAPQSLGGPEGFVSPAIQEVFAFLCEQFEVIGDEGLALPTYPPTYLHTYMHACMHSSIRPTHIHAGDWRRVRPVGRGARPAAAAGDAGTLRGRAPEAPGSVQERCGGPALAAAVRHGTHTHTHARARAHTHTHAHAHTRTPIHACICTCGGPALAAAVGHGTHTHTLTHTHAHPYIHVYVHVVTRHWRQRSDVLPDHDVPCLKQIDVRIVHLMPCNHHVLPCTGSTC